MHHEPYLSVPLFKRDGTIRAHTLVDPGDYERLRQHRWSRTSRGYVAVFVQGVGRRGPGVKGPGHYLLLHRAIMGCQKGDGLVVDHENGDRLDNRAENLRVVTQRQNRQNVRGYGKYSLHRGVCWDKTRGNWMAYIKPPGEKMRMLGRFATEAEAAAVAAAAREQLMPFSVAR